MIRAASRLDRMSDAALQVRMKSDPAAFAEVRRTVEATARDLGLGPKQVDELGLCVNEALANITRHAYGGAVDQPIELSDRLRCSTK